MTPRVRPIRRQLLTLAVIPLVSLIGLWGFATYLTVGDGYRLYNQGRLITQLAAPSEEILGAIQGERRASAVFLAVGSTDNRADLTRARNLVDEKIAAYRAALNRSDVQSITPDRVMKLAQTQLTVLNQLAALRQDVDGRGIDSRSMMDWFTALVDPITPLYSAVAAFPDNQVSAEGQALQRLAHARELRARTDAILAGALAGGRFTRDSYVQFVQAVGLMRAEYHEAYVKMTSQYRREVDAFFAKDPYVSLTRMEDAATATSGVGVIPVNAAQWREGNTTALAQLSDFQLRLAVFIEEHAKGPAYLIFARILIAGLIGLVAVIVTVWLSLRIARRLADRLRDLSAAAHTLSDVQLPDVVDRLRRGERVDVATEAPVLSHSVDEIGEVGDAFNAVRRTAIRTAIEQAELRAGIRNVFLNIARRSQTLVKRQLTTLDEMERKTVDPEELADLFRIDHLATRMRRYAENLVILGGGRPGRNWGEPIAVQQVLRGAASEAEHYERVRVQAFPSILLAGSAVSDVIHLVAELIDNATRFSPPHTNVQVSAQLVPHGLAIDVDDRGLGMSDTDLAAANGWLAAPPEFNVLALSDSPRLGMFVVARIASRHGIQVALRRSAYGGVTAVVLIPTHLVAESGNAQEPFQGNGTTATPAAGAAAGSPTTAPAGLPAPANAAVAADPAEECIAVTGLVEGSPGTTSRIHPGAGDQAEECSAAAGLVQGSPGTTSRIHPNAGDQAEECSAAAGLVQGSPGTTSRIHPNAGDQAEECSAAAGLVQGSPGTTSRIHPGAGDQAEECSAAAGLVQGSPGTTSRIHPNAGDQAEQVRPPRYPDGGITPLYAVPTQRNGVAQGRAGVHLASLPDTRPQASSTGSSDGTPAERTHLGLPVRVRQARLAPALRDAPTAGPPQPSQPAPPPRSADEVRHLMSAYQQGTVRGRQPLSSDADHDFTADTTSPANTGHLDEES